MKVQLIHIWGFNRLRYFLKCTLLVIKSKAKISYITSCVLFRIGATVKFINSKICVAVYNSLSNIVLISIRVRTLHQPIMGGLSPKTALCSSFGVRGICASFKTFWKYLSNGWYVRLSTSRSSIWVLLLYNCFVSFVLLISSPNCTLSSRLFVNYISSSFKTILLCLHIIPLVSFNNSFIVNL